MYVTTIIYSFFILLRGDIMKKLVSGLAGLVLAAGISISANAQTAPSYERDRLTEQPEIGTPNYETGEFNTCSKNKVRSVGAPEGWLIYSDQKGNIGGKGEEPATKPWAYVELRTGNVFIDVEGDGVYDFKQHHTVEKPCQVLSNLDKYEIK